MCLTKIKRKIIEFKIVDLFKWDLSKVIYPKHSREAFKNKNLLYFTSVRNLSLWFFLLKELKLSYVHIESLSIINCVSGFICK